MKRKILKKNLKSIKKRKIPKKKINEIGQKVKDGKENIRKKSEIDKILADFKGKMLVLEKKRDVVILEFLEILKQKQIEELKKNLNF
ncbi:MAG: hypothetical protein ABSA74_02545 [Candidatus Staskawiczbacteria bacterium]|jgi:hypothetical protein